MPKQTQIEKAIAQIDNEIAVLQAARARLVDAQSKAPAKRKSKSLAVVAKAEGQPA